MIKWSGSKRSQVRTIVSFFPKDINDYYEPFLGGGSVLYATNSCRAICGDICEPLISLWNCVKNSPEELSEEYRIRWERLQNEGYQTYYAIRDSFNATHAPEDLLFLSRTCVNGLIRFNAKGDFNNSLHHTRKGIEPERLRRIILDWSTRIQNTDFYAQDYRKTTESAIASDLIYLDPPYFHTKGRYYGTIDYDAFLSFLEGLNMKGIKYILSYDGKRGNDDYIVAIPKELYKRHELLESGNSSFKKVIDKEKLQVYESLYLNW